MIQFSLRCASGHRFDSWFGSSAAFDALARAGHLGCPECGDADVTKAPMAPRLSTGGAAPQPPPYPGSQGPGDGSDPVVASGHPTPGARPVPAEVDRPDGPGTTPARTLPQRNAQLMRRAVASLQRRLEATSDDVGPAFARQARAMHLGDMPARAIRGRSTPEETRSLAEDGVPFLQLPVLPPDRRN